jgi:hypothetical protein
MGESAPVPSAARPTPTPVEAEQVRAVEANGPARGPHPEPTPPAARPAPLPEPRPAEPTAPADLAPPPKRWERAAWYAGAAVLTCALLAAGYRLDQASLSAPLYYDEDSLLILPMVKVTIERGSHWTNDRLGYPGVMELYDYPVIDYLHFAILWLLGQVIGNVVVVYNLYYLLTYPLTTLTAMAALRQLRLTLPAAAVGGLLYAFLPYHYLRGENHYFLSAYWLVPLSLLPCLALLRGDLPFFRRADGAYRFRPFTWHALGLVVLGAATAAGGAYYAFFACALYAAAGVYAAAAYRTWRAVAAAGLLVGVVGAVGVVQHYPTLAYQAKYGKNPVTDRLPEEAELYGLKITHLVLPVNDHNLTALARVKTAYNSNLRPLQNENERATLGVVGAAGLVGLVGVLLLPVRKPWPYGPLAALTGFVLFLSVIGGFGAVFNEFVFDQVRCYNRVSVYLAFVCLFAALWWLDGFLLSRSGWARRLRLPVLVGVLLVGFFDQTPYSWFRSGVVDAVAREQDRFRADARFFAEIEDAMPEGAKVFTLPFMPFPEYPAIHRMYNYEPARGYLHTRSLVWSYGAIKGREADDWQRRVAHEAKNPESLESLSEFLRRVVVRGFDGLFIDTRGFPLNRNRENEGHKLVVQFQRLTQTLDRQARLPVILHEDREQVFLDLRPYRDALRRQSRAQFEAWAKEERELIQVIWLDGIASMQPIGDEDKLRWCGKYGSAVVINPADRARRVRLEMTFGVEQKGVFDVRLNGLVEDHLEVERLPGAWGPGVRNFGVPRAYEVEVPPGRHTIEFRVRPPRTFMPLDSRSDCLYIKDFKLTELK